MHQIKIKEHKQMKKCTYDYVKLLGLIDEYGYSRAMAASMRALQAEEDAEYYAERTSIAFKEILSVMKELEEMEIL